MVLMSLYSRPLARPLVGNCDFWCRGIRLFCPIVRFKDQSKLRSTLKLRLCAERIEQHGPRHTSWWWLYWQKGEEKKDKIWYVISQTWIRASIASVLTSLISKEENIMVHWSKLTFALLTTRFWIPSSILRGLGAFFDRNTNHTRATP